MTAVALCSTRPKSDPVRHPAPAVDGGLNSGGTRASMRSFEFSLELELPYACTCCSCSCSRAHATVTPWTFVRKDHVRM